MRTGAATPEEVARELGAAPAEVALWVASGERPVSVADVLASPAERRLARRAEALVDLIAGADELIRRLNERLAAEVQQIWTDRTASVASVNAAQRTRAACAGFR